MIYTLRNIPIEAEYKTALSRIDALENILIFDIETTGFNRISDQIISVTALRFCETGATVHQWFSEMPQDEVEMLEALLPYFQDARTHITYNGHAFDIPFLYTKYKYYNMVPSLNKSKCYDLYRIAKRTLALESYKLKAIEVALGINRQDLISGAECVKIYQTYLETQDARCAELILQHNLEDVLNLVSLSVLFTNADPETFNQFQICHFEHASALWYVSHKDLSSNYLDLRLWGAPPVCRNVQNVKTYLTDGSFIEILTSDGADGVSAHLRLPVVETHHLDQAMTCVDISRLDPSAFSQIEPYQLIVRYQNLWLYDHLCAVLPLVLSAMTG